MGDIVVGVGDTPAPTPEDIERAYAVLPSGGLLLLVVEQAEGPRVLALRKA